MKNKTCHAIAPRAAQLTEVAEKTPYGSPLEIANASFLTLSSRRRSNATDEGLLKKFRGAILVERKFLNFTPPLRGLLKKPLNAGKPPSFRRKPESIFAFRL